ncbi:MAG TPA: UDP-N-acetylmuramoyl-L-alanyl-D-glutamate--2,6-diaminopimelate ligase [Planctomycetota bacterium]|nr:UDP-N-acetylmuramoyl-L-alanyl-D-glutamate--2,6-diaminopimelate ligase [Planctomycetota bacterium]HRR80355.1 UDP-N-acetylmuramoyl-L-alanyl-D-glutamate--2,6-diaminopimelate ligase [Planctomycetota bacterium]HRT94151.1 UDP-N-acetylmuramoyl-L-alanyl-D-glutamate--2,6-diaminopimelate ligase [Planctomycetota bacterium]
MKLSKLLKPLADRELRQYTDRSIQGLTLDSRRVRPEFLFAVVPGPNSDGTAYVADAVARGAVAVLASREVPVPAHVALILVPNVRQALADLCTHFHGRPAGLVRTTGITGTNGKTTTAMLVHWLLAKDGKQAGLLTTVLNQVGSRRERAANTTPESPDLQELFAQMVEQHVRYAVMEVSSQSLDQERVRGVPFAVAALTNVTPHEHLDYHGTFENYLNAKARLFSSLAPGATAVLNADDPQCGFFRERRGPGNVLTYGLQATVDVTAAIEGMTIAGTTLRLHTPVGHVRTHSPLIGGFNVQNILAGTCCALALGVGLSTIAEGIEQFTGARGRLERVDEGQPFTVLVDYAHNNDGLRSVLSTLKPLAAPGRLIVVFGCGGDRDPSKRPLMGATATHYADVTLVTADNSRSERTEDIIAEILAGANPQAHCLVEPDRREAIRRAIAMAEPRDLVVICGKGHEDHQEIAGVRTRFDDCSEARRALGLLQRRSRASSRHTLGAPAAH